MPKVLHINLKAQYFYEIKHGLKPFEFRLKNDYWTKRLVNKRYDEIHFKLGYPKANDEDRIIVAPYKGYEIQKIEHKEFGDKAVEVFAIRTSCDFAIKGIKAGKNYFNIKMFNFIDNDKNKYKFNELPKDLVFQAVQGLNTLMACFWSDSKRMAYWWQLPYKRRDSLQVENKKYHIVNFEVQKNEDAEYIMHYEIKRQK